MDRYICTDFRSGSGDPNRGTVAIRIAGDRELKPLIVVPNCDFIPYRFAPDRDLTIHESPIYTA